MTVSNLLIACGNVSMHTDVMLYNSVEDFETNSSNWELYEVCELVDCEKPVARFTVAKSYIAIALA